MGFLGLELGLLGDGVEEEERMKTPTPTRTWGGIFWRVFSCFLLRRGLGCLLAVGEGCCCDI